MADHRDQKVQSLLTKLKNKGGFKRRKLIPELNQFTRNLNEFKHKTHNTLKGDAILDF